MKEWIEEHYLAIIGIGAGIIWLIVFFPGYKK